MEKDMNKEKLEMLIRDLEIPIGGLAAKCEFFFLFLALIGAATVLGWVLWAMRALADIAGV